MSSDESTNATPATPCPHPGVKSYPWRCIKCGALVEQPPPPATPGGEVVRLLRWLDAVREMCNPIAEGMDAKDVRAAVETLETALAASEEARAKAERELRAKAASFDAVARDRDRVIEERDRLRADLAAARERLDGMRRAWPTERRYIDASPDADYPVRILEAYIDESVCVGRGDPSAAELAKVMNDAQAERNAILRRAVAALSATRGSTP